jgi:hypothetical protein
MEFIYIGGLLKNKLKDKQIDNNNLIRYYYIRNKVEE